MQILKILLLLFSADQTKCDSLNGSLYNFSKKLSEVEFCQCVARESFDEMILPDFDYYKKNCSGYDVDSLKNRYKKLRKQLK
jgi:hypothetical protein